RPPERRVFPQRRSRRRELRQPNRRRACARPLPAWRRPAPGRALPRPHRAQPERGQPAPKPPPPARLTPPPTAPPDPVPLPRARPPSVVQSLSFRRTVIPILLTGGVMMFVLGSLYYVLPRFAATADSPLTDLPAWAPFPLFLIGLFFLVLAAVNMLWVKHVLD